MTDYPLIHLTIRADAARLEKTISNARETLRELQEKCPHETAVYSAHGSTGNWDRDDAYWLDHFCYDCGKRWTSDQSSENKIGLKVKEIDYKASPREIELEMELERVRREERK